MLARSGDACIRIFRLPIDGSCDSITPVTTPIIKRALAPVAYLLIDCSVVLHSDCHSSSSKPISKIRSLWRDGRVCTGPRSDTAGEFAGAEPLRENLLAPWR